MIAMNIMLDFFLLPFWQGVDSFSFNSQGVYPQPTTATYPSGKEVCNIRFTIMFFFSFFYFFAELNGVM